MSVPARPDAEGVDDVAPIPRLNSGVVIVPAVFTRTTPEVLADRM